MFMIGSLAILTGIAMVSIMMGPNIYGDGGPHIYKNNEGLGSLK